MELPHHFPILNFVFETVLHIIIRPWLPNENRPSDAAIDQYPVWFAFPPGAVIHRDAHQQHGGGRDLHPEHAELGVAGLDLIATRHGGP